MLTIPLNNFRGDVIGVLKLINAMNENNELIPFAKDLEPPTLPAPQPMP